MEEPLWKIEGSTIFYTPNSKHWYSVVGMTYEQRKRIQEALIYGSEVEKERKYPVIMDITEKILEKIFIKK
jgi:hypothetical protein